MPRTGLRPAATTALIDRLVTKGFVERRPSETDRRQVLVAMTEEGARRTWEAYGPMVTEGQQAFGSFTIAELERMRDLLDGRHRADRAAPGPGRGRLSLTRTRAQRDWSASSATAMPRPTRQSSCQPLLACGMWMS